MSRSGRWSQQIVFKNCGSEGCLQGCAEDAASKPHGPYANLRRRNPDITGQQDNVYLGKVPLTEDQVAVINEVFIGPDVPTKKEVYSALERVIL